MIKMWNWNHIFQIQQCFAWFLSYLVRFPVSKQIDYCILLFRSGIELQANGAVPFTAHLFFHPSPLHQETRTIFNFWNVSFLMLSFFRKSGKLAYDFHSKQNQSLTCFFAFRLFSLSGIAFTVILTFAVIWTPFAMQGIDHVLVVLRRIFPFYRGLYEVSFFYSCSVCAIRVRFCFSFLYSNNCRTK